MTRAHGKTCTSVFPAWQVGEHEELLQKKGRYYELYMTQFAENQI